jgi:transcriptional regulator with XRE-family HTH domain
MDAPASFGGWLKLRRWTLDLTQDAHARQVGCSVVTIPKLESDERRPSRQIAERLADALGIAPHERASFISLARAQPTLADAPPPDPLPGSAPERTRTNLPLQLTRLIGRKADVAAIRRALLRVATRLLTLTASGVGKTRLALHIATEVHPAFADGVCFVELAPIHDPDLVIAAIAQALGLREIGDHPLAESAQDYLHGKRLLLLDNFEQVVEAAPLVVGLLASGAGLRALLDGLDRRLALLTDGPRDLPLRYHTLRAAIAGSYELLNHPAQGLFRRLGVFVGGGRLTLRPQF